MPADLSRCAIHTMTNKPWSLAECCEHYATAGVGGISIWRNTVATDEGGVGLDEAVRIVKGSGLTVPAYVRGGFFPAFADDNRQRAIDHNKKMLDEAAVLGAEQVVLVVGAVPGIPLDEARKQVTDGIAACMDHAKSAGVKMSIEPLHPMYAGDKSCVNRMAEARVICEQLGDTGRGHVGIACDVYHVWWDPDLEAEIKLAGQQQTLMGFHICDWRLNTRHLLTDRGLMGDGCIDIAGIRRLVCDTGFTGFDEVEVFSEQYWAQYQSEYLALIVDRYRQTCGDG
ncbi:MAG: sugar phosphate isomerase/epimerase family protein [Planctomycetota bacterium]